MDNNLISFLSVFYGILFLVIEIIKDWKVN